MINWIKCLFISRNRKRDAARRAYIAHCESRLCDPQLSYQLQTYYIERVKNLRYWLNRKDRND